MDHFKVFIEFVTILFLFYVLFFWPRSLWDLSSLTRYWTRIPSIGRWSLTTWPLRRSLGWGKLLIKYIWFDFVPTLYFIIKIICVPYLDHHIWYIWPWKSSVLQKCWAGKRLWWIVVEVRIKRSSYWYY